ncbi:MAG: hypothetical protein A2Y79_10675 [Deltaproteobacteria bacterium RBG_13_43_22]|nr:MAG: hypothetical protein A2Y79_10675 [Deltaproteobacteria bacterium RBG_13_43_22]
MSKKKQPELKTNEKLGCRIQELNKALKERLAEFQRTETIHLPKVLPPAEELQELKMLIEWCLKLWAEHDGFIFKPGRYFNE